MKVRTRVLSWLDQWARRKYQRALVGSSSYKERLPSPQQPKQEEGSAMRLCLQDSFASWNWLEERYSCPRIPWMQEDWGSLSMASRSWSIACWDRPFRLMKFPWARQRLDEFLSIFWRHSIRAICLLWSLTCQRQVEQIQLCLLLQPMQAREESNRVTAPEQSFFLT